MVVNMTDKERMEIINSNYEHDKAGIASDEKKFGNMNYYLKREELIRKHLWKTAAQVRADVLDAMKRQIRGY